MKVTREHAQRGARVGSIVLLAGAVLYGAECDPPNQGQCPAGLHPWFGLYNSSSIVCARSPDCGSNGRYACGLNEDLGLLSGAGSRGWSCIYQRLGRDNCAVENPDGSIGPTLVCHLGTAVQFERERDTRVNPDGVCAYGDGGGVDASTDAATADVGSDNATVDATSDVPDAQVDASDVASADVADAAADADIVAIDAIADIAADVAMDVADAAPIDAAPDASTSCPIRTGGGACTPGTTGCDVEQVSLSIAGGCARFSDGSLRCWGSNASGRLGNGTTTSCALPGIVSAGGFSDMAAGSDFTCGVRAGHVECWGSNAYGQLGLGAGSTLGRALAPTPSLAPVGRLSAGAEMACSLVDPMTVRCWGQNVQGELGNGTTTDSPDPVRVTGATATSACTGTQFSCALQPDGSVSCWGNNSFGQLGRAPSALPFSSTPLVVVGAAGVGALGCGNAHVCALLTDRTVSCWGGNDFGQLANATLVRSTTPLAIAGLTDVAEVAAGGTGTCARRMDGTVWCWGDHQYTGAGSAGRDNRPVMVAGLAGVRRVWGGFNVVCALLPGVADLRCWGSGNLGAGSTPTSYTRPTRVAW